MARLLLSLFFLLFATSGMAQPPARLREAAAAGNNAATLPNGGGATPTATRNAAAQRGSIREFPTAAPMPDNAAWRRDVYRMLTLTDDANAPLYYPVTPTAGRENLFVHLFHLILRGQIRAYEYTPDALEHFDEKHVVKGKKILDDNHIFYEANEGRMRVNDADLPSEDVKRYYLKESVYFDQQTGTFRTKVLALCPIVVSDFGDGQPQTTPLFWVNYEEAAPHLAKLSLMASNLNNASEISADDYFNTAQYRGEIYQTKNLQDKTIAQMAESDSAQAKVREHIEQEIKDFQQHMWGKGQKPAPTTSIADSTATNDSSTVAPAADGSSTSGRRSSRRSSSRSSSKSSTPKAAKAPKVKSTPSSKSGTLSVRRQRH